ncbi:hypothetical protein AB4254_11935 [Vibrio breoganii]
MKTIITIGDKKHAVDSDDIESMIALWKEEGCDNDWMDEIPGNEGEVLKINICTEEYATDLNEEGFTYALYAETPAGHADTFNWDEWATRADIEKAFERQAKLNASKSNDLTP